MLKIYDKQDDIPEGLRSEYKQSGNKWVPDLSEDHPVIVLNKTLKQEKEVVEARAKKLSNDLDDALEAAKTSGVPRGQALVSKADAQSLEEYKALGTVDEVKVKVTEHGTLKADVDKRAKEDKLVEVASVLGYDNVEAFKRLSNLPDFDIRTDRDGKKAFALVKDGDRVVEKPAAEYLESSPDHSPFVPLLKTKPSSTGVTVNTTSSTTNPQQNDPFAWAREFGKNWNESKPSTDVKAAFGIGN